MVTGKADCEGVESRVVVPCVHRRKSGGADLGSVLCLTRRWRGTRQKAARPSAWPLGGGGRPGCEGQRLLCRGTPAG
jgi:hypothetical protein